MLGLLLPTMAIPIMPEIVRGAGSAAHAHGYLLTISDAHDDADLWAIYIDDLIARRVDGLLCYPFGGTDAILRPARQAGLPTILLNRHRPHPQAPALVIDDRRAFDQAFRDLTDRGHERIAMITPTARQHRFDQLRDALAAAGIPDARELERSGEAPDWARAATLDLMATADPPTAIFVHGVLNASAVANLLFASGYDIPGDVSLIAFGESDWTRNGRPPVSVVRTSPVDDARAATELLIRHIEGDEGAPRTLTRASEYVPRSSVGPRRPAPEPRA